MFSTIYAIFWEEQGLVYVGRSKNLNSRLAKHTLELENNTHTNYKLQDAWNTYGKYSSIEILDTVTVGTANTIEMHWINEFDSVNSGLNLIGGLIPLTENTLVPINVLEDTIDDSSKYKFLIVGPDNVLYKVNNMTNFVKSRPDLVNKGVHIPNSMRKMYREDTIKQCHGYRKYKGIDTYIPKQIIYTNYLIGINGITFQTSNLAEFCRLYEPFKDNWYAAADCLRAVSAGRYRTYKKHTCKRI